MVDKNRISATTKTPKFYYAHRCSYGCIYCYPLLKSILMHQLIHYLPRMHFYAAGDPTQHKTILLSKTNLSPAQEMRGNTADAVGERRSKIRIRQFVLRLQLGRETEAFECG
jgi:hypothetical protein